MFFWQVFIRVPSGRVTNRWSCAAKRKHIRDVLAFAPTSSLPPKSGRPKSSPSKRTGIEGHTDHYSPSEQPLRAKSAPPRRCQPKNEIHSPYCDDFHEKLVSKNLPIPKDVLKRALLAPFEVSRDKMTLPKSDAGLFTRPETWEIPN